jgi:hypothetical protein
MLSGDILYLDYREYKVHFPAHRFVLLGFDDEIQKAFIADRINVPPEACSYGALFTSRNPPEGISTHNLWGKFHGTEVTHSLEEACRIAIDLCARRMLGEESSFAADFAGEGDTRVVTGVAGIRQLAEELPSWGGREDSAWLASYNSRSIEKFGNGGGNFRRLYAGFLTWARELDAGLVDSKAPDSTPGSSIRRRPIWRPEPLTAGRGFPQRSGPLRKRRLRPRSGERRPRRRPPSQTRRRSCSAAWRREWAHDARAIIPGGRA